MLSSVMVSTVIVRSLSSKAKDFLKLRLMLHLTTLLPQ